MLHGLRAELHLDHVFDQLVEDCGAVVLRRHIARVVRHVLKKVAQGLHELLLLKVSSEVLLAVFD